MIRVLLADDHALVRAGIRALLEDDEDTEVVGEAANGLEAIELARSNRPDIVLMDVSMGEMNGIDAIRDVHKGAPDARVVIISMHAEPRFVVRAFGNGAAGYVVKSCAPHELRLAIDAVMRGENYVSPRASRGLVSASLHPHQASPIDSLSTRQRQVLQLLAEGLNTKTIARRLGISVKTVETHRTSIKERLGIRDVAGLIRLALEHELADGNTLASPTVQRFPNFEETAMNRDQAKGAAKDAAGRMQRAVGAATGNGTQEIKGAAKQVAGKVQKGVGNARAAVNRNDPDKRR